MEERINKMNENENQYIYATLILRGEGLHPQYLTDSLGLSPSMSFRKGDLRNETDRWKHNFWSLTSKGKIQSNNLATHVEWLMKQIEPVRTKFMDILSRNGMDAEISCFWILPTDNELLNLDLDLIRNIADLGFSLKVDVYCH